MADLIGFTITHRVIGSAHTSHIGSGSTFIEAQDILVRELEQRQARFSKFCTGGTHQPHCYCAALDQAVGEALRMASPGSVTANDVVMGIQPVTI